MLYLQLYDETRYENWKHNLEKDRKGLGWGNLKVLHLTICKSLQFSKPERKDQSYIFPSPPPLPAFTTLSQLQTWRQIKAISVFFKFFSSIPVFFFCSLFLFWYKGTGCGSLFHRVLLVLFLNSSLPSWFLVHSSSLDLQVASSRSPLTPFSIFISTNMYHKNLILSLWYRLFEFGLNWW